ncbi:hypothetical protein AVEN_101101-1 [Araneus ventricosus]|uniref:Uncharacterized protein n=1 Tax=Araneus ventricosus TaxID=182803 RepID=A0A4Y2TBS6_ARAVE|nr:hypothetical protein AVEN_101101-1 [Araneus ventricosus]
MIEKAESNYNSYQGTKKKSSYRCPDTIDGKEVWNIETNFNQLQSLITVLIDEFSSSSLILEEPLEFLQVKQQERLLKKNYVYKRVTKSVLDKVQYSMGICNR